jgi:hypothetical protein
MLTPALCVPLLILMALDLVSVNHAAAGSIGQATAACTLLKIRPLTRPAPDHPPVPDNQLSALSKQLSRLRGDLLHNPLL